MSDHDFVWSCDRRALKGALDRLKKTFDARASIPLLSQLEVTPELFHGGAVLRVTDLEAHHAVPVPGTCSGDRLLVDFRQLLKIVDTFPEGTITIRGEAPTPVEYIEVEKVKCDLSTGWKKVPYKVTEKKPRPAQMVRGTLGKKSFSLFRWDHMAEGNALPDTPACPPGFPCVTVELDLAALLSPVLHAVATDDSRYGMNGAQLEFYPDGSVGAVSTDGHRAVAHRARLDAEEPDGPMLPLKFCKNLQNIAPGKVTLTWWRPLSCGSSLSRLATVDMSRFVAGAPLYRVHFDLGGDRKSSRTVVRKREQVKVITKDTQGRDSSRLEWQDSISVVTEVHPKTSTSTVQTTPEVLALLLTSQVSLDDWLLLPDVAVSGDVSHLHALYAEIGRSDVVQVEHPDGTVLVTQCLEGDFPDWRQVVPKCFLREATVDRKVFDEAIKYVMTVASEKTHCVRVALRDGAVLLSASNPDEGELSDEVPAEMRGDLCLTTVEVQKSKQWRRDKKLPEDGDPVVGDFFKIGFNGQYLRDELKVLGSARVEIQFGDTVVEASILRRPVDDSLLCLVMPMRIE